MKKHLTYKDDKSDKFWQIEVSDNAHTVTFGKTGSKGTSKTKKFVDNATALKNAERLLKAKLKKGYTEGQVSTKTKVKNKPKAPINSTEIEDWESIGLNLKKLSAKKIRELLADGFDVNTKRKGHTLLYDLLSIDYTRKKKTKDMSLLLIEAGSPLDSVGYQSLVGMAVGLRFLDLIETLLEKGAEADLDRLLIEALCNTHMHDEKPNYDETIKFFLDKGANPNQENTMWNLMHRGNIETLENFVAAGLDLNAIDEKGNTALHIVLDDWSSFMNKEEATDKKAKIRFLLKHKPDLNLPNKEQNTAMHIAASNLTNEVVFKELVEAGGNLLAKNANNKTVIDVVKNKRSLRSFKPEFITYLEETSKSMTYDKIGWSWDTDTWKKMTPKKLKELIDGGAPLNAENQVDLPGAQTYQTYKVSVHKTQATLLTMVIAYSSLKVIKALFESDFLLQQDKGIGSSYYNDCWLHRRYDVAEYLVSKGLKIDAETNPGVMPLLYMFDSNLPYVGIPKAFYEGNYDLDIKWIKLYTANGGKLNDRVYHSQLIQNIPFKYSDDINLLSSLIDLVDVYEIDLEGISVFDILKKRNFLGSKTLEQKAIKACKKNTLVDTLRNGTPKKIKSLFKKDFTPNTEVYAHRELTAFYMVAAYNPDPKAIDVCMEAGGKFHVFEDDYPVGYNTFTQAAMHNSNPEVLQKLMDLGDSTEWKYNDKSSFVLACLNNPNLEVIQFLINTKLYKVNEIIVNNEVRSPFMFAVIHNSNPEVIKLLLQQKAKKKISTKKRGGYSAEAEREILKNPYLSKNEEIIELLKSPQVKEKTTPKTKTSVLEIKNQEPTKPIAKKEKKSEVKGKEKSIPLQKTKKSSTKNHTKLTPFNSNYHYRSDYARTASHATDLTNLDVQWIEKLTFSFKYITPISKDQLLLSGDYGGVALFDLNDRKVLWRHTEEYWQNECPIVYKEMICVPSERSVHLFEIASGQLIKRIGFSGGSNSTLSSPILVDDKLYLINRANINVIDLEAQKLSHKIQYFGKTRAYRTDQEPIFQDNKFWIFTKKGKKKYLEGVALTGDSVQFELPKLEEIDNSEYMGGIYYNEAIYTHTRCGKIIGIHTKTGEVIMNINLYEGFDLTHDLCYFSLRCSEPALLGNQMVVFSVLLNEKEAIYFINLDKNEIEYTLDILGMGIPNIKQLMVGEDAVYLVSAWHDIIKAKQGEMLDWVKIKDEDKDKKEGLRSIEDQFVLLDQKMYAVGIYELEEDGDTEYCNAVICVGQTDKPDLNAYTRIDINVKKAKQIRSRACDVQDPKEKLKLLNQGLELDPKNSILYNDRGLIFKNDLKDKTKALSDFDKAIENDSQNGYAYFNRAFFKIQDLGKPVKESYADFDKAVESKAKYVNGYIGYAEFLLIDNEYKKALKIIEVLREVFAKGIRNVNENIWAIYLECMCLYMSGKDYAKQESELRKFLKEEVDFTGWSWDDIINWYQADHITKEQQDYLHQITSLLQKK